MTETIDIKQQVKEALVEFFAEDSSIRNIVADLMEDIALGRAIEQGDVADYVDEKSIIDILKSGH